VRYNQIQWDYYPAVYTSFFQDKDELPTHNGSALTLFVYLHESHPVSPSAITAAVHEIDPNLPVGSLRSTNEIVSGLRSQPRLRATMLGGFGMLTLLLAAIGIGGVMAQMVEQRRRDIGIRIALGALASDILELIFRNALGITMLGIVAGLVGAAAVARLLHTFLYGVPALDPITFAAVILLLAAVSIVAAYVPARRAARVDPMVTLRSD